MPIKPCKENGKSGYKWGDHGKCYPGEEGKVKAQKQSAAAHANGYHESQNSFLKLFTEKATQSNLKISQLIGANNIPLTTTMMDRLGYVYESEAWHATDIKGVESLKSIEGTKKQISAFTKGGTNLMSAIVIRPKYIVKVAGNIILEASEDMWSNLDKNGTRWVRLRPGDSKEGDKLRSIINDNTRNHLIKEYNLTEDDLKYNSIHILIQGQPSKARNKIYKWYFDMIERTLNREYQLLNKHLKNKSQRLNYNEVIINNIKVLGAYILSQDIDPEQLKKLNIPFLGYIDQTDLSSLK